jgi:D-beta-D-heptose 7-phosphate kinase/D-beta-D-heptose 1-phosphate adenosyltransferase
MQIDFAGTRVLVVGDVMLDSYWHGATSRISPEAPVPVVRIGAEETRAGGAANVAVNVAGLGAAAQLIGLVGDDATATQLEALVAGRGVDHALHRVPGSTTIRKLRILSRHQQLIRLDFEEAFERTDRGALDAAFAARLGATDVVILSDYAKGLLADPQPFIAAARARGLPVVVDPKGTDFARYRGATILTPNLGEFEAVAGRCADDAEIAARGLALCGKLALGALLVTRSEHGMTLLVPGAAPLHLAALARDVYDVTGAGDTVVATLGAALGAGMALRDAVALSNVAAGLVVGKLGTATVSAGELKRALNEQRRKPTRGVVSEAALAAELDAARAAGERIVMTNGCFDILHPGHVDYLGQARALGDRLVVAVNADESVRRLKGPGRPVNALASRMRLLAALACVDWVVAFGEDTPERLICALLPDVLVKGGDYRADEIAGGACVRAAGGEVRVLDFLPGHSSSATIDRIRRGGDGPA